MGFAAAEGGRGLSESDVPEADILDSLQFAGDFWIGFEEFDGLAYGHVEDVGDGLAAVADFQGLTVVAFAVAHFAVDENIREEVHLDGAKSGAFAGVAASAGDVEGEASRFVAADFGAGELGEELPDVVEDADVGGRVGAWSAADWGLVDFDDLVDILNAFDAAVGERAFLGMIKVLVQDRMQRFVDEA